MSAKRGALSISLEDLRQILDIPEGLTVLSVEWRPSEHSVFVHVEGEPLPEVKDGIEHRLYPIARCAKGEYVYKGITEFPHDHPEAGSYEVSTRAWRNKNYCEPYGWGEERVPTIDSLIDLLGLVSQRVPTTILDWSMKERVEVANWCTQEHLETQRLFTLAGDRVEKPEVLR